MVDTKSNSNGIWKQNVSTSESALKKRHFCEWAQLSIPQCDSNFVPL